MGEGDRMQVIDKFNQKLYIEYTTQHTWTNLL